MTKPRFKRGYSHGLRLILAVLCLVLPAAAHNGPPFPILVDQKAGPCNISVWTHPDIGTGTFFVMVNPLPGGSVPSDLKVRLGIQPVSGRLPEVFYDTVRDTQRGQVQFNAVVDFDRQDFFRVRIRLESAAGNGEAMSQVEATPAGFGKWDLLYYLSPFLLLGAVLLRGILRRRKQQARQNQPVS